MEDLSLGLILQILNDETATCCGPRPDYLTEAELGNIYVERSSGRVLPRRRTRSSKTDRWDMKMHLWTRPVRTQSGGAQRDARGDIWVRCSYGTPPAPAPSRKVATVALG